MTISSYVLSLSRANEYTWMSDLRYHIQFKWDSGNPEDIESWICRNILTLPFIGKYRKVDWSRPSFALNTEEDLILLLVTYGEQIKWVIDLDTEKTVYGTFSRTEK